MIQSTSAMDRPVGPKKGLRRTLQFGVPALILLVGTATFYPAVSRWFSAERSVELSRLRLGTVTRGDLERDISVQGRVVAAFHPTAFSPAGGIIQLQVRAGEVVEQGRVLARIDSPELDNRLKQERSSLEALGADLERRRIQAKQTMLGDRQAIDLAGVTLEAARRAMLRAERSRSEGILNDVEYEQAQDALRMAELALGHARQSAELRVETLEFEIRDQELRRDRQQLVLDEVRRQVAELAVRAPVAGLVSRIDVEDRDAVTPGQPLVTVVDMSAFEVEVAIPENYAGEIGPGLPTTITYDGRVFPAEIRSISPEVEGNQVQAIVGFTEQTPEGLRQNQRVSARLIIESRHDVLKLPRGPFLDAGGGRRAFVVDGTMAVLQPIQAGAASVDEVEILSGLTEGDQVIISDTTRFEPAKRLYLRR